jgi:alpha-L-fucosidase
MANRYTLSGNTKWFEDAAFGLFMHWGIYSVAGMEASWPLKRMGSEDGAAAGLTGWSISDYEKLASDFVAENYDPGKWMSLAAQAGMKYAVLTTKHHDGFCLWDTKTKDFNSVKMGPKKDLVAPYVEACRKAGLKVGLYFSLPDWTDEDYSAMPASVRFSSPKYPSRFDPEGWNRYLKRVFTQVEELLTNYGKIDLFFFDVPGWAGERWCAEELKIMMLNLQPHIICNDRLPDMGDYKTPEQQIPLEPLDGIWETCMTMNHQWSWSPIETTYKSATKLLRYLVDIRFKGGNFLLNVGPKSDGTFPQPAIDRLEAIGEWMAHSGASLYGCRQGIDPRHFYGPTTCKNNTLYLHVFEKPSEAVELRGLFDAPVSVHLLRTGDSLKWEIDHKAILIDLPLEKCSEMNTVIAVEFAAPPRRVKFSSTIFAEPGPALW